MFAARTHARRVALTSAAAIASATFAAPAALADGSPPPNVSAVQQYVETVPTAGGGSVVGVVKSKVKPLPKKVNRKLQTQGGSDREELSAIATSSAYGAPQEKLATPTKLQPAPTNQQHSTTTTRTTTTTTTPAPAARSVQPRLVVPSSPNAVSAAASAAGAGRLVLFALLLLSVAAAFAAGAMRRRSHLRA